MEESEKQRSILKPLLVMLFFLIVLVLLGVYWFMPFEEIEFISMEKNPEFRLDNSSLIEMQFYDYLRYPEKRISYMVADKCSLKKKNDMIYAFEILENLTVLDFYEVNSGEEITISCDDNVRIEEDFFIAGEGGPTNITKTEKFNVITHGMVLLIEDSECEKPNVAIHELLHALGFEHSNNEDNIMYNFSKCGQQIGEDIPNLINEIYSIESLPDLEIENAWVLVSGKYLDANVTIRNNGLKGSKDSQLVIFADKKAVREISIDKLDIGYGTQISLQNVLVNQFSIENISLEISYSERELSKKNNKIELKIN